MKRRKIFLIVLGIIIILLLILLIMVVLKENRDKALEILKVEETDKDKVVLYYEFADRNIYLHGLGRIAIKYKGEFRELKDLLNQEEDFLNKFIKMLGEPIELYKDGGSRLYQKDEVTIIVCQTLDNNYGIHIGVNLTYEGLVCQMS